MAYTLPREVITVIAPFRSGRAQPVDMSIHIPNSIEYLPSSGLLIANILHQQALIAAYTYGMPSVAKLCCTIASTMVRFTRWHGHLMAPVLLLVGRILWCGYGMRRLEEQSVSIQAILDPSKR